MPVRNLLDDDNSLPQEKKIATGKNIENFDHNSAENDDFDNGRIWKSKMSKNWVKKSKTQKSFCVLRNIISKK